VPAGESSGVSDASPDRPLGALIRSAATLADVADVDAEIAAIAEPYGGDFKHLLVDLRAASPFLWRLAALDPARLATLAAAPPRASAAAIVAAQSRIGADFAAGALTRDEAAAALRRNRNSLALLVALADLGNVWSVEQVTATLSDFADASVTSATRIALLEAARTGKLVLPPGEVGAGCGLVVLALGKHGAGELNYSSDIDLVVFFDPECGAVPANGVAGAVYSRVAQSVARLLQERTQDGYVHRVDYRLRPDPGSTPVAVSLPAAYSYYETVGQNWERAAMIKARPVAGDLALGHAFLAEMKPFIWRKYFDFAAIADIHAMKRQIHAVRGHDAIAVAGHDIKLGRGGIREIEFFVQTQQLVFGGRRPALRGQRTLDMLGALHEEGWISAAARDELRGAYRFLRGIEHRLQMVADEQTQRLPVHDEELERFARFAGYDGVPDFAAALTREAARVQHHYGLLFESSEELASELGDLVFTGPDDDPGTLATLARLGFQDASRTAETVRGWHFGRRPAVTSARAREVLTELVPALLEALGGTADPDNALSRLDAAFGRMPAAVELLTILKSNRRLRLLFADLLGTAPRLAEAVAVRPHVLDAIIDPAFTRPTRDEDAIEVEARAMIGQPAHMEDFLDRVRDTARQLQFVVGARLLSGVIPPRDAGADYAAIARAVLRTSLDQVELAFAAEHGRVPDGRVAIVGMGRLGAGDLTAASDLDLVVLYDFDEANRTSDGARPLDAVVYYTRLTKRLIAALTVPTRRGRLYEVDLRLRPSGSKGPIATQLSAFTAYHARDAELWEQMALTRARPLAGDAGLCAIVRETLREILARPRDRASVFSEIAAMRSLIAAEKGEGDGWDLKLAAGGLTDLDFLVQAIVLSEANAHPDLVGLAADAVLVRADEIGGLPPGAAPVLLEARRVLGDVQHWQRLTLGNGFDAAGHTPATMRRLAAVAGAPDAATLRAWLDEMRAGVRSIFDRVLRGG
jgi:glutamate-ammonia-ligase adenylyltransferase